MVERFFGNSIKEPVVNGIINLLKVKNDSLDFVPRFVDKYGMPIWDNAVYVKDYQTFLLVPFKNPSKKEIEGVWVFKITSPRSFKSFPITKEKTDVYSQWAFDYFTYTLFNIKPQSGNVFKFVADETVALTKGHYINTPKCVKSWCGVGEPKSNSEGWIEHCWSEWKYVDDEYDSKSHDIPACDHLDFGDGGGGVAPQPENKNKDKLPNKKPKTVVNDCEGDYEKIKESNNKLLSTVKDIDTIRVNGNKKPSFKEYLTMVHSDPLHEHSMSIQNHGEDGLVAEPINTGTESSVLVVSTKYTCADIHNHPNDTPPSPRDLWVLVSNANNSNNYNTRFVIGKNGDYYAMNVTDQSKVKAFYEKYGSIDKYIDSNNDFKKSNFQKDWNKAIGKFKKLGENDAWCYALAYIMQKYDMGITMLSQKKDEKGFTSMHMKQEIDPKYSNANYLIPAKCK